MVIDERKLKFVSLIVFKGITFVEITLIQYLGMLILVTILLLIYSIILGCLLSAHIKKSFYGQQRKMRLIFLIQIIGSFILAAVSIIQSIAVLTNLQELVLISILGFLFPISLNSFVILALVVLPAYLSKKEENSQEELEKNLLEDKSEIAPTIYDNF